MKRLFSCLLTLVFVFALAESKAQNIFIKIFDQNNSVLAGQSQQVGFTGQTEILSFGQESSSCAFNGPSSCTPVIGNFIFNIYPDAVITDIRAALHLRRMWRKVEISFTKQNGSGGLFTYQKITLTDVFVTGLSESNDGNSASQIQVKLDPKIVSWAFTAQNPQTGAPLTTRTITYDRVVNTGSSN